MPLPRATARACTLCDRLGMRPAASALDATARARCSESSPSAVTTPAAAEGSKRPAMPLVLFRASSSAYPWPEKRCAYS
eukprot:CAMPEP_0202882068 /NCGR_PEP_ID=MMETSP1391-20130828/37484_1 /ASSEMBLY_ACC=CAM_ASM_000867 /TAXON_ID=1034604 /ORGANISM="Chlamydomonas leiostraca, Strain SAG 11-49" /LENGTH=78 /DNA_ID=CAMNT_0049564861 /DNA_START=16 /DNA_END=248 /DNA_ORIENTATION=-